MEKKEKAIKECDFYVYFGSAKYKSDVHKFAANVLLDELENILGKEVDVDIEKSPLEGMYHVYLSFVLDKDVIEEKVKKIEQFVKKNGGKFKKTRNLQNTVCNVFELDPMKVFDFHSSGSDEDEIIEELLDSAEIECITNMLDSKGDVEIYKIQEEEQMNEALDLKNLASPNNSDTQALLEAMKNCGIGVEQLTTESYLLKTKQRDEYTLVFDEQHDLLYLFNDRQGMTSYSVKDGDIQDFLTRLVELDFLTEEAAGALLLDAD